MLLLLLFLAALWWCGSSPGGDREVLFEVLHGWGGRQVASALEDSGLVRCSLYTLWRGQRLGVLDHLQAGTYLLSSSMSPDSILLIIASGRVVPVPTHWVTLPEGLMLEGSIERLASSLERDPAILDSIARDADFVGTLGVGGRDLEGYLFPETYEFADSLPHGAVLSRIVEAGLSAWGGAVDSALAAIPLGSRQELIVLASIVEREARVDSERPRIARVFLNRLERGLRLESCATVQYALGETRERLLYSDLRLDHPYNTYLHAGLPPGPICSPGLASILAVAFPDTIRGELYFVSRGDSSGLHLFATTLAEHRRNVRAVRDGGG
ncbi:endolytic transglycosylase MltG [Candidatus Fermentibacterales bacterium]|nr:endolytic transglycosylase MltG [Candidatus Fermentibacterales bacterium]